MRLGLIGYGNIAQALLGVLADEGLRLSALDVLARAGAETRAAKAFHGPDKRLGVTAAIHTEASALIAAKPDLVVEVATHEGVMYGVLPCLKAGIPCVIVSVGALADAALDNALRDAAKAGKTRLHLVPGAVGGIDALVAARLSGLTEVTYTSRKPPRAWQGTPAETLLDLGALTEAQIFFEGTAREAATAYPKNANVAATVALAGAGMDATRVRMIADPAAPGNVHEVTVRSDALDFTIRLEGKPSPDNPKTSLSTVYSVAREILNAAGPVAI
ncbi:aspartate dehydrogenase [Mesobacterium pallidum]|uniref:aspartate dehydrogenase n=1 Tax=Mesobacterium pallidum TaxID=2872037 RepID=UPI001EE35935|nr:aspartate dehydrogenase [Mesobacterium pallidum]